MKKLTTLLLVAASTVMLAQIPNPCLGTWSAGSPASWISSNIIVPGSVIQSGNPHGSCPANSAELYSVLNGSNYYGGSITTWNGHTLYFPNTGANPVALNGWYQLTSVSGDELQVSVGTKDVSGINGFGKSVYSTNAPGVWKQFSACIVYISGSVDSATISMSLTNKRGHDTTNNGSSVLVDDLSWGACGSAGVDEVSNNSVTLEAAYPNPASGICNIIFSLPCSSTVNVSIYDLSGRKVLSPLENTTLSDGRYKVPVDVTNLANGVYEYTVTVNGMPYTQKLVVTK